MNPPRPLLSADHLVDAALDLFTRLGALHYGERVSQLDHALQTAHNAAVAGESEAMVAAALLHDIGHLLHSDGEDAAQRGIDTCHEAAGARWLAQGFGLAVSEPVRLHVAAKRYRTFFEPAYLQSLSAASLESLHLQGGPMTAQEAAAFAAHPHSAAALRLRTYDDLGKRDRAQIPPLAAYRPLLLAAALPD